MKLLKLPVLMLIASFALYSFTLPLTESNIPINSAESAITWKGYKVTGEHSGTIDLKEGSFVYENGELVSGEIWIDMTSIKVTDLKGEYAGKLEGHLKSTDFFGVETNPTAHFKITQVISRGMPGDYKVIGDLTIKNITKEIKFLAKVNEVDGKKVAMADINIDRSDFNIRYGSGSFFDNLGDKTIYDEFDLSLKLVTE